jgi:tRNA dimethylallyltransferase
MERQRVEVMKKPKLIILTGPTSAGKTALSIELARRVNGEIISADSMQVYRHMDIGSGKITKEEMAGIPHHLIDVLEPTEKFHVAAFQNMAKQAMAEIYAKGKQPILVGGTGFYIQAVLYDIDFSMQEENQAYRQELENIANTKGTHALHEMLQEVDKEAACAIHENNKKRVIRALEFYHETGQKISGHNEKERQKESPYDFRYFVLTDERSKLYERIEQRVDRMIQDGLAEEVSNLLSMGCEPGMTSMQGLGYKEIVEYLNGEASLEEAVAKIKLETRHFAKRQLTWFRRERDVIWLDRSEFTNEQQILAKMMSLL